MAWRVGRYRGRRKGSGVRREAAKRKAARVAGRAAPLFDALPG